MNSPSLAYFFLDLAKRTVQRFLNGETIDLGISQDEIDRIIFSVDDEKAKLFYDKIIESTGCKKPDGLEGDMLRNWGIIY